MRHALRSADINADDVTHDGTDVSADDDSDFGAENGADDVCELLCAFV